MVWQENIYKTLFVFINKKVLILKFLKALRCSETLWEGQHKGVKHDPTFQVYSYKAALVQYSKLNLSPCSYTGLSKHSLTFIGPDKLRLTDHAWWPVPDTLMKNSFLLPSLIYAHFLYSYLDILAATLRLEVWIYIL